MPKPLVVLQNAPATPLPPTLKNAVLIDAIRVSNEMIARKMEKAFPKDLSAEDVLAHLHKHLAADMGWRTATQEETEAIAARNAIVTNATARYARLRKLIDADFPLGTPGRSDFFPAGSGEHSVGTLMQAAAAGAHKHQTSLPEGWTAESLRVEGEQADAAAMVREDSGEQRKGQSTSRTNQMTRTREIRRRLRDKVEGLLGEDNPDLVAFGMTVKKVRTPRRR
jgi:hypothetical protein